MIIAITASTPAVAPIAMATILLDDDTAPPVVMGTDSVVTLLSIWLVSSLCVVYSVVTIPESVDFYVTIEVISADLDVMTSVCFVVT